MLSVGDCIVAFYIGVRCVTDLFWRYGFEVELVVMKCRAWLVRMAGKAAMKR